MKAGTINIQVYFKFGLTDNNDHWIRNNLDIKDKIMSIFRSMEGWMKSRQANSICMYNTYADIILYVFIMFSCSFVQYCRQC